MGLGGVVEMFEGAGWLGVGKIVVGADCLVWIPAFAGMTVWVGWVMGEMVVGVSW